MEFHKPYEIHICKSSVIRKIFHGSISVVSDINIQRSFMWANQEDDK